MTALLDLPVLDRHTPSLAPSLAPSMAPSMAPSPARPRPVSPRALAPARAPGRRAPVRGSGVGGCAVDPATLGAFRARTRPAPLRLTRRARLLVSTLTVVGALGMVGLAAAQADPGAGGLTDAPASVVVQPGDTLWQIAVDVAPGERPAEVVELLQAANGLDDVSLQPGQVLTIPRS